MNAVNQNATTSAMRSARWDPGWYNLDQSLKAGHRGLFAFFRPEGAKPGHDLTFANAVGTDWDYRTATVVSIEHARFGPVEEVDTTSFGQYTFRFTDGCWVTVEAEEAPGAINAASPGFPADACDRAGAETSGWALSVTLTDVATTRGKHR